MSTLIWPRRKYEQHSRNLMIFACLLDRFRLRHRLTLYIFELNRVTRRSGISRLGGQAAISGRVINDVSGLVDVYAWVYALKQYNIERNESASMFLFYVLVLVIFS